MIDKSRPKIGRFGNEQRVWLSEQMLRMPEGEQRTLAVCRSETEVNIHVAGEILQLLYPVIEFLEAYRKLYRSDRSRPNVGHTSAGKHPDKILAYALWSQNPYVRKDERYQVWPMGKEVVMSAPGRSAEVALCLPPRIVNPGVLCYLFLIHGPFDARR